MSIDSFFTAISDATNLNDTEFIKGNKGRFKVIHFDETNEGIEIHKHKFLPT